MNLLCLSKWIYLLILKTLQNLADYLKKYANCLIKFK